MKALITGITGFAGTHLAEHLLACGDEVLGVSQSGAWHDATPAELPKKARLLQWNLACEPDEQTSDSIAQFRPEVVYHLAGLSVPSRCGRIEPTPEALAVNVDGVRRVMEMAVKLEVRPRVLLVSSRHVYARRDGNTCRAAETDALRPTSGYGQTKRDAEILARQFSATEKVEVMIARAFNHTGPRQMPPLMLADWCEQLVRGERPLKILNDNTWLDLSDVRDIVVAYRVLAAQGCSGETYNVGSGFAMRTGEIAQRLVEYAAPGRPIEAQSHEEHHNPIANVVKLTRRLDWRPRIRLSQTIADTWQFWVERATASS